MTDPGYLIIWIVAMAIMTIFVLTIGTLAAADMLRREKTEQRSRRTEDDIERDSHLVDREAA
jgi:hypothetical protein